MIIELTQKELDTIIQWGHRDTDRFGDKDDEELVNKLMRLNTPTQQKSKPSPFSPELQKSIVREQGERLLKQMDSLVIKTSDVVDGGKK